MLLRTNKRKTEELSIQKLGHDEDLDPVLKLRNKVFNTGSDFMQADRDYDPKSIHIVAKYGAKIVAAARFSPDPNDSSLYTVNRVATDPEHQLTGIGSSVMSAGEQAALEAGAQELTLNTHTSKKDFYEKLGFVTVNPGSTNEQHIIMHKKLT